MTYTENYEDIHRTRNKSTFQSINYIKNVEYLLLMTDNIIDDAAKKMKNSQQDFEAKAETAEGSRRRKTKYKTLNKAKVKIKDALIKQIFSKQYFLRISIY